MTRHASDPRAEYLAGSPVSWCTHPRVKHVHGTAVAYTSDKCCCPVCGSANKAAILRRARAGLDDRYHLVDAEPVRTHVRALMGHRMGRRQITLAAAVSNTTLTRLLYGRNVSGQQRRPARYINYEVAARLLAVEPVLADGTTVDAIGTHRRIQALVVAGWPLTELGRRLDKTTPNLLTLLGSGKVQEGTRRRTVALYSELRDAQPVPANRWEQSAVTRAKRYATSHGWAAADAWDDDTIDDPEALPYDTTGLDCAC